MNTQTSLVAEQIRLQQWADQIRDCQNRPSDMKVDVWCQEHGITKANYYYRLRRVREACLEFCDPAPSFVEPTAPAENIPAKVSQTHSPVAATLHTESGITIATYNDASTGFLRNLIGAASQAQWGVRIPQNISCHRIHGSAQRHGRTGQHHTLPFSSGSLRQKFPVSVLWQENRPYQGTPVGGRWLPVIIQAAGYRSF